MKCAVHKNKNAITYCSNCGRGVCENCLVETSKGNLCKECFKGSKTPQNITDYAINEILNNKILLLFIVGVILFIILIVVMLLIPKGGSYSDMGGSPLNPVYLVEVLI